MSVVLHPFVRKLVENGNPAIWSHFSMKTKFSDHFERVSKSVIKLVKQWFHAKWSRKEWKTRNSNTHWSRINLWDTSSELCRWTMCLIPKLYTPKTWSVHGRVKSNFPTLRCCTICLLFPLFCTSIFFNSKMLWLLLPRKMCIFTVYKVNNIIKVINETWKCDHIFFSNVFLGRMLPVFFVSVFRFLTTKMVNQLRNWWKNTLLQRNKLIRVAKWYILHYRVIVILQLALMVVVCSLSTDNESAWQRIE